MSDWVRSYFAEYERRRKETLARAEAEAAESGKELFELRRFEQLLNRGSQAAREQDHRLNYYVLNPELRTLADYATHLLAQEPWEDNFVAFRSDEPAFAATATEPLQRASTVETLFRAMLELRSRFGAVFEVTEVKDDDYRTFGPRVYTAWTSEPGWLQALPRRIREPADTRARREAIHVLCSRLRNASNLEELRDVVAHLPSAGGIARDVGDARETTDGLDLAFVPPIPVVELVAGLLLHGALVRSPSKSSDGNGRGWVLLRFTGRDEPGAKAFVTIGAWTIVLRLGDVASAGDVMVSMSVARADAIGSSRGEERGF